MTKHRLLPKRLSNDLKDSSPSSLPLREMGSIEPDFDTNIERIAQCRLSAQYTEARRLLSILFSRAPSSLSTLQRNIIAIEKSELLTNVGFHRRTETALRKAIRVSSHPLNGPAFDLTAWSHAVLLANMAFVQLHTKGKIPEGLRLEMELRKKFLEGTKPDESKVGLYVIPRLFVIDSIVESEA